MAYVKKQGKGYKIVVSNGTDINGKKIRETATFTPDPNMTAKQQEKALEVFVFEFEQKVKSGKVLKGEKLTLKEYVDMWLRDYAKNHLEFTSYQSYEYNMNTKILPALGHIKLSELKPHHIQSLYNNLLEDGVRVDGKKGSYSIGTIKKCHVALSSALNRAMYWQMIESNPCVRVELPKSKNMASDIKYFTLEQTERFLSALDQTYTATYKPHTRTDDTGKVYQVSEYTESRDIPTQFKVFFYIALFGGLRCGELLALTWDDIDFTTSSISITKSITLADGNPVIKAPKTETSIRTITLPSIVMQLIKQYKIEQYEYRLSLGDQWIGDNHLFIQWNGKLMNKSTPYHTFKRIIKKYNATVTNEKDKLPQIPLHGLRHTSATLLIAEKVDVKTVSARLGHSQTSTTMDIYAHALKELDKKASDALEQAFKKTI